MSNDWIEAGRLLYELLGADIVAVHLPGGASQHRQWIAVEPGTHHLVMMQPGAVTARSIDAADLWPSLTEPQRLVLRPAPFVDRGAGDTMAQVWAPETATMGELHEHWECWLLPDPV